MEFLSDSAKRTDQDPGKVIWFPRPSKTTTASLKDGAWPDEKCGPKHSWQEMNTACPDGIFASRDAIGILMAAASNPNDGGYPALQPIWAYEAMHRAYGTLRLFGARHRHPRPAHCLTLQQQCSLARDIAVNILSLETSSFGTKLPCRRIISDLVNDTVALFSNDLSSIRLFVNIEEVNVPDFKRRALVLMIYELLSNVFLHALHDCKDGYICVELRLLSSDIVLLRILDNGIGFCRLDTDAPESVADMLAALLDTEIHYGTRPWRTNVSVYIPC